jgi:DNA-binding NtrC family response regulator
MESHVYDRLREMKILLIDDDELIRDSLSLFFSGKGVHLSSFETAEMGLDELEKNEYDIIIVDYRLPGIDGVEFFKIVQEKQKNALKILITAYKDHKVVTEADKIGIQDIIEKPFTSRTIEQALSYRIVEQEKKFT